MPNVTPGSLWIVPNCRHTGAMGIIEQAVSDLHLAYVEAINIAVADNDLARAERLGAEFDVEVLDTIRAEMAAAA